MAVDVLKYMRRKYDDCAHPCMALVADVLAEEFHIGGIPSLSPSVGLRERAEIALEVVSRRCAEVTRSQARGGDVVLVRIGELPMHIGILISQRDMLHVPDDRMGVVVESLDSPWIKQRVYGIYRPLEIHGSANAYA